MNATPGLRPPPRRSAGIVLPIALILLVVITLVGVATMRGVISAEDVTKSVRSNTVAMQAAETALRFCETQAIAASATLIVNPIPLDGEPVLWRTRANWSNATITNILPATLVTSADARQAPVQPRCLIETYRLRRGDNDRTQRDPFQITAVGYSPDYRTDSSGRIISGGEVWLQSVLRLP